MLQHNVEPQIEHGTIGWEDTEEYHFLGSDENDGHTLVRVQLYRGRDHSKPLKPEIAQGHRIVCHINGLLGQRVPPKGTRVLVAFPKGMEHVSGAGVIIATIEKNPGDSLAEDRIVHDYGPNSHVVFRAKSVSLQDYDNRFITVGTPRAGGDPGLWLQASDGTGGAISEGKLAWWVTDGSLAQTIIQMTPSEVKCMKKSGGYWSVDASGWAGAGTSCSLTGSAVYLGRTPAAVTPAIYGLTGIAGVASLSVFISAT